MKNWFENYIDDLVDIGSNSPVKKTNSQKHPEIHICATCKYYEKINRFEGECNLYNKDVDADTELPCWKPA